MSKKKDAPEDLAEEQPQKAKKHKKRKAPRPASQDLSQRLMALLGGICLGYLAYMVGTGQLQAASAALRGLAVIAGALTLGRVVEPAHAWLARIDRAAMLAEQEELRAEREEQAREQRELAKEMLAANGPSQDSQAASAESSEVSEDSEGSSGATAS